MFNKETEYALRALVYIQKQNNLSRRPGLEEIADEIESPKFYTAKILQNLVRRGFLESSKGRGGGFYFDENKPDLSLSIVIEAIEGSKTYTGCGFGLKHCDCENPCPLHEKYADIRKALSDLVSGETIQSLARQDVKAGDVKNCD